MNDELNGFLSEESQGEPQVEENKGSAALQEEVAPETQGEPTSPSADKHVPLAALEAERSQRKDWKERALRLEGEMKAMREQRERIQEPQEEQRQMDPIQVMQQRMLDQHYNTSQLLAKQSYKDLDEKVEVFMEAAKQNPALVAAMQQQAHPYEFAYREAERMLLQKEMGNDPSAFRAKMEAEIEARILEKHGLTGLSQSAAPAAPKIPASLAGARSSAGRTAGVFTGPPSLDDILKQ